MHKAQRIFFWGVRAQFETKFADWLSGRLQPPHPRFESGWLLRFQHVTCQKEKVKRGPWRIASNSMNLGLTKWFVAAGWGFRKTSDCSVAVHCEPFQSTLTPLSPPQQFYDAGHWDRDRELGWRWFCHTHCFAIQRHQACGVCCSEGGCEDVRCNSSFIPNINIIEIAQGWSRTCLRTRSRKNKPWSLCRMSVGEPWSMSSGQGAGFYVFSAWQLLGVYRSTCSDCARFENVNNHCPVSLCLMTLCGIFPI